MLLLKALEPPTENTLETSADKIYGTISIRQTSFQTTVLLTKTEMHLNKDFGKSKATQNLL
jgi:hypothetical protein